MMKTLVMLTAKILFVGSKDFKVGNASRAEAMRVIQTNQGGQIWDFVQTFRKSHFCGRWSYSGGARWRAASGYKSPEGVRLKLPHVKVPMMPTASIRPINRHTGSRENKIFTVFYPWFAFLIDICLNFRKHVAEKAKTANNGLGMIRF